MLFEESNTEEISQETEQKFCQKVERQKTGPDEKVQYLKNKSFKKSE